MELEGKVAIVTGAGRGIGRGIALCLAKEGADVVVNSRHKETAGKVADEVKSLGRKSLAIEADVTDSKQIDRLVQETIDTFGKIDILVNNVGGHGKAHWARTKTGFVNIEEEEWDETYELTFKTQVLMSRAVVPYFIKQKSGKIINIGSIGGSNLMGTRVSAYMNMKAAALHFTKELAAELAEHNINVNCVSPGWVWTPLSEKIVAHAIQLTPETKGMTPRDYFLKVAVLPQTPLKRPQTAEDIGHAVAFLASEDARNITGQPLLVNGGSVML